MFSKRSFIALASVLTFCLYSAIKGHPGYAFLLFFTVNRLFMHFPTLIHKKKTKLVVPQKRPGTSQIIISHRGGSMEAPENTLQAFNQAIKAGTQFLDCDVSITKDGQLILCHDTNLQRLCGDPRNVKDIDYKDLPDLQ